MAVTKKNDFVEVKYTGYANGVMFDSNIEEDLKQIEAKAKPVKTIVSIGNEMILKGFDSALIGKEIGKEYNITLPSKEAFGDRNKKLLQVVPLKAFHQKNLNPQPGMTFAVDDRLVKVIAVSGARVTIDFNNPLAGKEIKYKFTISRAVNDDKEKAEAFFHAFFRFAPEFEVKDKIVVKGQKGFNVFVDAFKEKFKELVGKELVFEEIKEEKKSEKKEDNKVDSKANK